MTRLIPSTVYKVALHSALHSFPTRRSSDLEETSVPTSLAVPGVAATPTPEERQSVLATLRRPAWLKTEVLGGLVVALADRKSTRLNSSHVAISYAVFCL